MQSEYSLCTRNPEIAVLEKCRRLGAAFVAFSPLGRGFLSGAPPDVAALDAKDIRRQMPRFSPANHASNLALLGPFDALAREAGCSRAQLALAWVLSRGDHVLAIPGTTHPDHLGENVAAGRVRLAPELGDAARRAHQSRHRRRRPVQRRHPGRDRHRGIRRGTVTQFADLVSTRLRFVPMTGCDPRTRSAWDHLKSNTPGGSIMKSHPSLCGLLCTAALWAAPPPAAADSRSGPAQRAASRPLLTSISRS